MEPEIKESTTVEQDSIESLAALRYRIIENLINSGFSIEDDRILSVPQDKEFFRKVHVNAVAFLREKKRKFIEQYDEMFLEKFIINGTDLDIHNIRPVLSKIDSKLDSALFN